MSPTFAIEAEGLVKRYDEKEALAGVDIAVPIGTVTAVLGPNGAGKTTAVRILTTLSPPTEGRATVAERPMAVRSGECVRSRARSSARRSPRLVEAMACSSSIMTMRSEPNRLAASRCDSAKARRPACCGWAASSPT